MEYVINREGTIMAQYRVTWEQKSANNPNAKPGSRHVTTVQASSIMDAKAKVMQRIPTSIKVVNMTASKIG